MDKSEAERLIEVLLLQRPNIQARPYRNGMTRAYEIEVTGGDPRHVRLWLKSPRQVLRYIAWLGQR